MASEGPPLYGTAHAAWTNSDALSLCGKVETFPAINHGKWNQLPAQSARRRVSAAHMTKTHSVSTETKAPGYSDISTPHMHTHTPAHPRPPLRIKTNTSVNY